MNKRSGFTIVELLIVIVVIGVLAAITIVSYSGVNSQAIAASVKSDLSSSSRLLKVFNIDNDQYPAAVSTNCQDTNTHKPNPVSVDQCYQLKLSRGNEIESYSRPTSQTFVLAIKNNNIIWEITDSSAAVSITPAPLTAAIANGAAEEDSTLTASATPADASTTASYQWQRADNSSFTTNLIDIPNATNNTYTLTSSDVNKHIRVRVTGTSRFPGTQFSSDNGPVLGFWITLGTQTWTRKNLNVGTRVDNLVCGSNYNYDTGEYIDVYCPGTTNNGVVEKECYNNLESNCTTYGGLYPWDEMMQYTTTAGAQGICPTGSHIPTDSEWKTLEIYLGMTQVQADSTGWRGSVGTSLKSGGSSGFNALLAGTDDSSGFNSFDGSGAFWTSSSSSASAWPRIVNPFTSGVYRYLYPRETAMSVRCVKN